MEHCHNPGTMSQKIFSLGLNTETVSLYLLCCGLIDAGDTLSVRNLKQIWNSTPETLTAGLKTLADHGILRQVMTGGPEDVIYSLNGDNQWLDK